MSTNAIIKEIETPLLKKNIPSFSIGDEIKVSFSIVEGEKERIQSFIGTVIARKGRSISETVSLYRIAHGSAMERVFLLHSPKITKIEVLKSGRVRRAKLYYLRGNFGKAAKVKTYMGTKRDKSKVEIKAVE